MPSGSGTSMVLRCLRAGKFEAAWKLTVGAAGWCCRHTAVPSPCHDTSYPTSADLSIDALYRLSQRWLCCCRFIGVSASSPGLGRVVWYTVCKTHLMDVEVQDQHAIDVTALQQNLPHTPSHQGSATLIQMPCCRLCWRQQAVVMIKHVCPRTGTMLNSMQHAA